LLYVQDVKDNAASMNTTQEYSEYGKDRKAYDCLLKNELLSAQYDSYKTNCDKRKALFPIKDKKLFEVRYKQ